MEMPKPTEHHARLAALAGTWEGDETLHPAPGLRTEIARGRGRFVNRMILEGMFLETDYEESQGGRVVFSGRGIYGFDSRDGTYTMHWFDRIGLAPETVIRGRFAPSASGDGGVLTFEAQAPFGRVRYVYALHGPDEFAFSIATSVATTAATTQDGAVWTPFLEGRYRRVR